MARIDGKGLLDFFDLPAASEEAIATDSTLSGVGRGYEPMSESLLQNPSQLKPRARRAMIARANGGSVKLVTKRLKEGE